MVQALRSFKLWNKCRKYLAGECDSSSSSSNDTRDSYYPPTSHKKERKLGAPFWAQVIGYTFSFMVLSFLAFQLFSTEQESGEWWRSRRLRSDMCSAADDEEEEDCPSGASHPALLIVYFFGVFYIFIGIAIVCDEFFVPSLEQIGMFLDLSDDVCGATLMAAGGSAPELATSLIGTFQGSDVGFGTIVGSAVFNVLFVIASCVMSTPTELAPLELTGWPLARDCCYYAVTLIALAVCFGATSPGIIEGWEAAFLFCLYLLYEYFNPPAPVSDTAFKEIETPIVHPSPEKPASARKEAGDTQEDKEGKEEEVELTNLQEGATGTGDPPPAAHPPPAAKKRRRSSVNGVDRGPHKNQSVNICPSNVRAGFFHLICQDSVTDTAGVAIVNKIKGDVRESFDALDKDNSGTIDMHELKGLLKMLAHDEEEDIPDSAVEPIMKKLDLDGSGSLDFAEFTLWYVSSKERLNNEVKISWVKFDKDHMGMPLRCMDEFLADMNLVYTEERYESLVKELLVGLLSLRRQNCYIFCSIHGAHYYIILYF